MVVFALDNAPESVRGMLTRWTVEIKPGVFIGNLSNRVRNYMWEKIIDAEESVQAVMAYSYPSEQGFKIESIGIPVRHVCDFDGLQLIGNRIDRQYVLHKMNTILSADYLEK